MADEPANPSELQLIRALWSQGSALAAIGLQASVKAADGRLVPVAAGAALRRSEAVAAASAFKADPALWSAEPLAPMTAFKTALEVALERALGQSCRVSAQAMLSPERDTALIACAAFIPEPLDMSQWGLAQSRMRSLLRLAGVEDPMSRAQNAILCSLEERWDDWIEEIAVEASPSPRRAEHPQAPLWD